MTEGMSELLGWYGVVAILLAYGLVSFGVITADEVSYQLLNLTGAFGILIDAYMDRNMQPVVLNVIWMVIAAVGLVRVFL